MFELAYLKNKDDYLAKELSRLFKVKEYYALLLFIYPILRDLRRITKLFQCHTGDNIQIFHELKDFIHNLARRFMKPEIIERNNIYQLMKLEQSLKESDYCILHLDDVNYGGAFLREISKFNLETRMDLRFKARDFMKTLFLQMANKLSGTLETVRYVIVMPYVFHSCGIHM